MEWFNYAFYWVVTSRSTPTQLLALARTAELPIARRMAYEAMGSASTLIARPEFITEFITGTIAAIESEQDPNVRSTAIQFFANACCDIPSDVSKETREAIEEWFSKYSAAYPMCALEIRRVFHPDDWFETALVALDTASEYEQTRIMGKIADATETEAGAIRFFETPGGVSTITPYRSFDNDMYCGWVRHQRMKIMSNMSLVPSLRPKMRAMPVVMRKLMQISQNRPNDEAQKPAEMALMMIMSGS
jgi:hypothetical protein